MARRRIGTGAIVVFLGLIPASALAQMGMGGRGRSLGGYGAAGGSPSAGYSPLPVGGRAGVLPAPPRRMAETPIGGSSAPSFRESSGARMGARRPASSGGMGMGLGGSVGMPMTPRAGIRRGSTGPGFGWPFTAPPSYSGSGAMGMP